MKDVAVKVVKHVAVKRSKNCDNITLQVVLIAITHRKTSSHSNNNATTTSIIVDGPQDTTDPNCTDGKDKHKDPLLSTYQVKNDYYLYLSLQESMLLGEANYWFWMFTIHI